jgi:hypothetical protein
MLDCAVPILASSYLLLASACRISIPAMRMAEYDSSALLKIHDTLRGNEKEVMKALEMV